MSRIRDQRILSFAAGHVWATDEMTRNIYLSILSRHYLGVRLSDDELNGIRMASSRRPAHNNGDGSGVAVVPLWGVLMPHAGMMVDVSTEGTGLDAWAAEFRSVANDPEIGTIVLRVHSGGGSAQGVEEAAKIIRDARSQVRVVGVADGTAASGAFWLLSQCDEAYATPSGLVGAVHCYTVHEDISAMLEADGVKVSLIGAPDAGAAEAPDFLPLSDENRSHMQGMVEQYYGRFVRDVAKARGVSESVVRSSYGGGRVLTAQDAFAAGMIDGVKSYEDVLSLVTSGRKPAGGGARARAETTELPVAAMTGGRGSTDYDSLLARINATRTALLGFAAPAHEGSAASPAAATATPFRGVGEPDEGGRTMDTVTDGRPATLDELAAQRDLLDAQMQELNAQYPLQAFPAEAQAQFDQLEAEHGKVVATIRNIEDRTARLARVASEKPGAVVEVEGPHRVFSNVDTKRSIPDNVYDLPAYRAFASTVDELPKLWKEGALRVNEKLRYQTRDRERVQAFVERVLDLRSSGSPAESFSLRLLGTANPVFEEAFAARIAKRPLTTLQEQVFRTAVSNTGLGNETPVPITIDPTVLLDSDGTNNPIRRLARNVTITGDKWRGLATEGVTFAYSAELAAVDPVTPTFRGPEAEVERAIAEVQGSWEVFADWPSLRAQLGELLLRAKNDTEANKFLLGNGSDQPEGLIWALDDDGTSVVETATINTLALGDIKNLDAEMPPRFEDSAQWLASKAFYSKANDLSQAANGYDIWKPLADGLNSGADGRLRYTLLGSPTNSASEVSKLFTTGGENVAVLGDFQRGFVIVDRIGMNVLFDEIVRDGNGKIIGAAAVIAVVRNTSKLLSPNAFRMLQIKAS